MTMDIDYEGIKQGQKKVWSSADYRTIAATIEDVSQSVIDECGASPGQALLDVATGTGNAALIAARAGAEVTGLDLTPRLLEVARERAASEGLSIRFDEGDAEDLPYAEDSFDRVVSVFGVMFAPDQERAAGQLMRVCRDGGKIVVAAWTPEGLNGGMFALMGKYMPPPPEGLRPPTAWGSEDRARELFSAAGEVRCERRRAESAVRGESTDAWLDYLEENLGPVAVAKQALGNRWPEARADLHALFESHNEADDGSIRARPEYLLTVIS